LKPNIKPKIKRIGKMSQPKNIIAPAKIIKISNMSPKNIKKILIIAPNIREMKLEKITSKYFPISNCLGKDQLYLRQGENRVFKSKGIEK